MTGLEVPIFSPASARAALSRGAGRIEVNREGSYPQGGLTPDESEVGPLSDSPVPLRVMIRPRGPPPAGSGGGPDFIYSGAEFEEMKDAIRRFKACGYLNTGRGDGFVFGVLKEVKEHGGREGRALVVDADRNRELVQLAHPFPCVFHRAFDEVIGNGNLSSAAEEEALHAVAACGFDGILTSGGPGSAADHIDTLSHILQRAADLEIIVGGGVRSSNVQVLKDSLLGRPAAPGGSRVWFHSSCLTAQSGGGVDEEEVDKITIGLKGT
ncbi:hypothetical protein VMCG_04628 [Cytospora schulzeri]|uniref:Copper homeostasis protein cutC homolog n=1 Tax=Cytospora schulzeri TaxID=448051 RepID=A0A423WS65_9PEZI|nr:hypothetical protein VMCG_04628 [Valsa malicola]